VAVALRWTIGDVSARGFAALRLSIIGARRAFGPETRLAVCVNTVDVATARARTSPVPEEVLWQRSDGQIPGFLRDHLDRGLAEGVAWKFAPMRLFPDDWEIALDNDCILWAMPEAVRAWLAGGDRTCLLAEDVAPAFGQFAPVCGPAPRNSGIRGLPPGFDLEAALAEMLRAHPVQLVSELDEQGLQVAALSRHYAPAVVPVSDVAICSPFPPHTPGLGRCGAHFVGLNVARPRPYCDAATLARIAAHWDGLRERVAWLCGAGKLNPLSAPGAEREIGAPMRT
jgi:hypothetical protein